MILTLPKAIQEIHKLDAKSAINETMLKRMIAEEKLPYGKHGVRVVVRLSVIFSLLNDMLGLEDKTEIPKLRTIRDASSEIKQDSKYIVVGEDYIRDCVSNGVLPSIAVGNRHYVALQCFAEPYSDAIIFNKKPRCNRKEKIQRNLFDQFYFNMALHSGPPKVTRKHNKNRSGYQYELEQVYTK